jgi:hypothetical protein
MKSTVLDLEVHSNAKKTYFVTQSLYRNGILFKGRGHDLGKNILADF